MSNLKSCDNLMLVILITHISPLKVNNYWVNSSNYHRHHPNCRENPLNLLKCGFLPWWNDCLSQRTNWASKFSKRIKFCYLHRINHPNAIQPWWNVQEMSDFFKLLCKGHNTNPSRSTLSNSVATRYLQLLNTWKSLVLMEML